MAQNKLPASRPCTCVQDHDMKPRIAVLASGTGSNLQALLDAVAEGSLDAEIAGVFSDKPAAPALQRVPETRRWSADPASFVNRLAFDAALAKAVAASRPDWVVCAGYMRILGEGFIRRFEGRLLNIHPSLLPKYRGLHTHRRALEAGDREHGASVHLVVPELDAGAVIAQASLPVLPGDTPKALAQRLLPCEHALLGAVMRLAVSGRLSERDGHACHDGQPLFRPLRLDSLGNLTPSDDPTQP